MGTKGLARYVKPFLLSGDAGQDMTCLLPGTNDCAIRWLAGHSLAKSPNTYNIFHMVLLSCHQAEHFFAPSGALLRRAECLYLRSSYIITEDDKYVGMISLFVLQGIGEQCSA
jgi:hypothetical protein